MLETILRPAYQRLCVDLPAKLLVRFIDPVVVTFLGVLAGVGSALLYLDHYPVWAVVLLLLSGYLDSLDGTLARYSGKSSPHGAVLDIFADRLVEFVIILALFLYSPASRGLLAFCMLGSVLLCVTSFLVVGVFVTSLESESQTTKGFHYSRGLMERAEAFCFFIAMMLIPTWFDYLAWIFIVLVSWTAVWHIIRFVRWSYAQNKH